MRRLGALIAVRRLEADKAAACAFDARVV